MNSQTSDGLGDDRLAYWRGRLGRIHLGVEPVEDQLEKYRRSTLTLLAVLAGLALMFLALFSAFRRPDVGALLILILLAPIAMIAWRDYVKLRANVAAYLEETEERN